MRKKLPASECPASALSGLTTSSEKLNRFTAHIQKMIHCLEHSKSIAVHHRIDQSWYMQKEAELILLQAQIKEARQQLEIVYQRAALHYTEIYPRWYRDLQWLKTVNVRPNENN